MFDTVNFWIYNCDMAEGNPFAMLQYLEDHRETIVEGALISSTGKIGDYKVNIKPSGVSFTGSLCKYYLPSNLYTLTRRSTQEAIEMLSDQLHTDMRPAKVTRLDVSTVLPMSRPPKDYYTRLGARPYFQRVQATGSTLYYNTKNKQQVFYDKTKEAIAKGAIIPDTLKNSNLLRYELRYRKKLQSQLKTGTITASQLYDDKFYYSVIKNWRDEFNRISKINKDIDMSDIKHPTEARERLFSILLKDAGQNVIDEFINDLKGERAFADPKYYTRLKSYLNKLIQHSGEQKDELLKELESAINNVAKYAR